MPNWRWYSFCCGVMTDICEQCKWLKIVICQVESLFISTCYVAYEGACSSSCLEDRDSCLNLEGQGQERDYRTGSSVSEAPRRRLNQCNGFVGRKDWARLLVRDDRSERGGWKMSTSICEILTCNRECWACWKWSDSLDMLCMGILTEKMEWKSRWGGIFVA